VVEFRILGPLEVVEHDRLVAVGAPKVRALLAVLLLHRGEVVSTDRLIDALWGERASDTAAKTVQVYVSNLRKALGDGLLLTRGGGYVLQTVAGQVDADRFEALAADGRRTLESGDPRAAGERLGEALALWRGPPLSEFAYEQFAQSEIARLEEVRLETLEDRIDTDLAAGERAGLVAELEALVAEHPVRERLHGQLMLALYRSGRQADALEHYRNARQSMVDELGLEPGPRLQELERAILAQDPTLDPAARASRPPPGPPVRSRRGGWLIAAAGAVLLAALVGAAVKLSGSGSGSVRVRVPANSVAVIDPRSDTVVGFAPVGTRPGPVVFGSGSVWVANLDDQTVSRIDPSSLQTLRDITLPNPPTDLAAGAGAIWVAQSNPGATSVSLSAIDPQFDTLEPGRPFPNLVPGDPAAVATQGGAVWVAPSSGLLTELNSVTGRVVQRLDPNSGPAAIAVGDGAVWLTDTSANNVTRVDPTGLLNQITVGNGPIGIAVGEGGVWIADSLDDTIVRIDPGTQSLTSTIPVGHSPDALAIGAGSVWVADSGDGTVTRIDPRTDKVQAIIAVGGSPQAITIADGRAWVTVDTQTVKPTELAAGGGTLRMETELDPGRNMDPAFASDPVSWQLLYATCAKLLNFPDKSGPAGSRLIPEVARSLPIRSTDGKTYTFAIRPGFRFSPPSDQTVTAQTFKYTIERSLSPKIDNGLAHQFANVVGEAAYTAGKASHISGVTERGDSLVIHLLSPAPDFPAQLTLPAFCAVPTDTPIDPRGVQLVPSAGPYYVTSFTPGQGVVLARNPNYTGSRPHQFAGIEVTEESSQRAVSDVEAGTADYAPLIGAGPMNLRALASGLAARYGPGSQAARQGDQQYFVSPVPEVDYFYLNTHRPLFADVRMRQAASYAIDRRALARLGDGLFPLPAHPTDHYLPPGIPGYIDTHVYPLTPDLAKARALARGKGGPAMLYTCDVYPCAQEAQILKTDLAAIGIQLQIRTFSGSAMYAHERQPGARFDIGFFGWVADHPDPANVLPLILEDPTIYPTFDDPTYQRRLTDTGRLTGPARYLAYGKLDLDLARNAAPLLAYGNPSTPDFFSTRIGCQAYGFYGMDLAALCIKRGRR
jgi:YVTN family beta-propeller protein